MKILETTGDIRTEKWHNDREKEKKKQHKFSDSQDQEKKKTAIINCLCLYQSYETEMLKWSRCGEFSHSICYNIKTTEDFDCVTCTHKARKKCKNKEIEAHRIQKKRTYKQNQDFVFKLNKRRVLKSILTQEFLTCQPGNEPSTEYMKIRFSFSGSYAARITLNLVKDGLINF